MRPKVFFIAILSSTAAGLSCHFTLHPQVVAKKKVITGMVNNQYKAIRKCSLRLCDFQKYSKGTSFNNEVQNRYKTDQNPSKAKLIQYHTI